MKKIIDWVKKHKKMVLIMTGTLGTAAVAGFIIWKLKLKPTPELIEATTEVLNGANEVGEVVETVI